MSTRSYKHHYHWKFVALRHFNFLKIVFLVIALMAGRNPILHKAGAQSDDSNLLNNMNPEDVFEISLLLENGAEYHHYLYVSEELGVCDVAQPEEQRPCQMGLEALATQFKNITVFEYTQSLPKSIDWSGPTPTPIVLTAEIKAWNAESNQARRWKIACSVVPDQPTLAVCARLDRLDHFSYALVAANQVISLASPES